MTFHPTGYTDKDNRVVNQETKKIVLVYDSFISPTPKSFLVTFGDEKVWLPQSLTEICESDNTLTIPWWLAVEKELEDFKF